MNNSWKYISIREFANVITGGTPSTIVKEYWDNGNIPWLNSGELNKEFIESSSNYITELGLKNSAARLMPPKTVLIALTGATTGKSAILNIEACANQSVTGILPSKNHNPYYLFYYLNSIRKKILDISWGGAQKHINQKFVQELKIPLPPLDIQDKIASILINASSLIKKRQETIKFADEFLRSTFLEMFGDPVRNSKNWKLETLPEIAKEEENAIRRGPFGSALLKENFVAKGYLVYEQYHALNDDYTFKRYFVDENKFNELKAFKAVPGDLIISCSGVYLGKISEIPLDAPSGIINQALLKISLDHQKVLNKYFLFLFRHPGIKYKLLGDFRGSGIPNFPPMTTVNDFKFPIPPIELQKKFESIVMKTTLLKEKYKTSLTEMENQFNSLMQKAFRGEL